MIKTQNKRKIRTDEKGKEKRTFQGILFDSELELKYYRDILLPMKQQGIVTEIELQPKYELQPKFKRNSKTVPAIKYIADFKVTYPDGSFVIIDVKGMADPCCRNKRKEFWFRYPDIRLNWVGYRKKVWKDWDEIQQDIRLEKKLKKKLEEEEIACC